MSFTHTNAPASTSARPIAAPTPLPPPVTSARRPSQLISNAMRWDSDFHHDGDHDGPPARAFVDELAERTAGVPAQRVEVERAFGDGAVDCLRNRLLRVFEELFGFRCVDPTAGDDLGAG